MKNIKHSNKVLSADNQQERLKIINPWYIKRVINQSPQGRRVLH